MVNWRAVVCAALVWLPAIVHAQDVNLTSPDGSVSLSGDLLSFDGEFYRLDTIYGELTVDASGVICTGPGCPDLEAFVAEVVFSGASAIGTILMPALLEAFAIKSGLTLAAVYEDDSALEFELTDPEAERVVGRFEFRTTNSDEAFADLLADEADVAMSLREISATEIERAQDAGLGNLDRRSLVRVLSLDAIVPVVSPNNPVQLISLADLSGAVRGDISNWADLGGPDAPIAVHVMAPSTGLGQATLRLLFGRDADAVTEQAVAHETGQALARAVASDPFALGLTSQVETDPNWPIALTGECGFALHADRRAVKSEDYPFTAPMFLYLPPHRLPKLVRAFLSYVQDPSAQLVIRRAGYVDQAPEEIGVNEQGERFANAISHAGPEISLAQLQEMTDVLGPLKRLTTTFRFETGSARLDAQSRSNIDQLARALEAGRYDARRLLFVGFSDGQGSASTNQQIALRRAEAVRAGVIDAAPTADLTRLELDVAAFGEAMPMACDESEWGRRINRRVEVWVR